MLAIIQCLKKQKYLLESAQTKFEIWGDHKNLEYFMSSQKLNQRQVKWTLYLSRFDFMLKYILGSSIGRTDSLSRCLDWQVEVERDNKDRVLVKKKQLEVRAIQITEVVIGEIDLLEKIKKSEAKDNKVVKAIEEMK